MPSECVVCKAFFLSFIDELEPVTQEGLHSKKDVSQGEIQTACNENHSESVKAAPDVIDKHEDLEVRVKKLQTKISSFHPTESSIVGFHIEKRLPSTIRHVHTQVVPTKTKKMGQGHVHCVLINFAMTVEKICLVSAKGQVHNTDLADLADLADQGHAGKGLPNKVHILGFYIGVNPKVRT